MIDIKNSPPTFKSFLSNLEEGKWSMEEFDRECAYWFINCGFSFLSFPPKPKTLEDYDNLSEYQKRRTNVEELRYAYNKELDKIISINSSNLYWLKRFLKAIPKEDITTIDKFRKKIEEFIDKPPIVKEVQDIMGGTFIERSYEKTD
jgi:hypothetical protein